MSLPEDDKTVDVGEIDFNPEDQIQQQEKYPYLIVMSGKNSGNMFRLNLDEDPVILGRSDKCDITFNERGISRQHAKLYKNQKGNIAVRDLNSTNGTFVNGQTIETFELEEGNKIYLGKDLFVRFTYQDRLDQEFFQNVFQSAKTDGLTGVLNKSSFQKRFLPEFNYCRKRGLNLSLVFLDIDHFKSINDTYGHKAGDYVLKKLAERISENIRNEDLLARYGGEEFVIVQRQTNKVKAYQFAERIRSLIEETTFEYEGNSLNITVSMGISTLKEAKFSKPSSMIKKADSYLYQAKSNGRNRVESVYNSNSKA